MGFQAKDAKTVAIVANRQPFSGPRGHLQYMHSFVRFLEDRGHRVHIVLSAPTVPFIYSNLARFFKSGRIRIDAPGLYRIGRWHFVAQPIRLVKNIVSKVLSLLPPAVAAVIKGQILNLLGKPHITTDAKSGDKVWVDPSQQHLSMARRKFVVSALKRIEPYAIFFDGIFCAAYCKDLGHSATKYVITHDVNHKRIATLVARGYEIRPRLMEREDEADLLRAFDVIVAIQPEEAQDFAAICPDREVITIPFPIRPSSPMSNREVKGRCLFVGSSAVQNIDGLQWLLREVWPSIAAHSPDFTLHVCGSVCEAIQVRVAGVVYRGIVPDLEPEYSEAALVLVPLHVGSGLKIKILEALSYGCPCLTTKIGVQGMLQEGKLPFIVADAPDQFADLTIELLSSEQARGRLRAATSEYCAQYSPEHVFQVLIDRGL